MRSACNMLGVSAHFYRQAADLTGSSAVSEHTKFIGSFGGATTASDLLPIISIARLKKIMYVVNFSMWAEGVKIGDLEILREHKSNL